MDKVTKQLLANSLIIFGIVFLQTPITVYVVSAVSFENRYPPNSYLLTIGVIGIILLSIGVYLKLRK